MALTIKTEKVVVNGMKYIKVLKINSLIKEELPIRYTNGESIFRIKKLDKTLFYKEDVGMKPLVIFLVPGCLYTEKVFYNKMTTVRRCGNNLMRINKVLAKENKGWEGKETHTI